MVELAHVNRFSRRDGRLDRHPATTASQGLRRTPPACRCCVPPAPPVAGTAALDQHSGMRTVRFFSPSCSPVPLEGRTSGPVCDFGVQQDRRGDQRRSNVRRRRKGVPRLPGRREQRCRAWRRDSGTLRARLPQAPASRPAARLQLGARRMRAQIRPQGGIDVSIGRRCLRRRSCRAVFAGKSAPVTAGRRVCEGAAPYVPDTGAGGTDLRSLDGTFQGIAATVIDFIDPGTGAVDEI